MSVDQISPRQPRPAGDTKLVRYEDFIESKIESTRRMVKLVDLAAALVTLFVCVLAFLLVVAVIEHWIVRGGFNVPERTVLFAILFGAIGYFGYRRVWPLLVHTINPVYAAHTIEHSSPTLKNSLINLLLFRQRRTEISDPVYRTLEAQAAQGLTRVPVETAVDRSLLIRLGYVLLAVVALAGLYKVISPKDPLISAERILLPWADIVPASRVTITNITPGTTTVSRGESIDVSAEVRGIGNDDAVLLRYATDDGQVVGKTIPMKPAGDGLRYVCRLTDQADGSQLVGLTRNLKYRLEAGDARSLDYSINVVSAPSILVERIDYHYPPYTGFVDRSVDALGDIRAIEGTRITIHARANGVIRVADVDFDADGRSDVRMAPKETKAVASFELGFREEDKDRQTPRHASYVLRFTNDEGRVNRDPVKHSIAVERDLNPEATVLAPKEKQIDARLDETVAIEVEARDPDFALSAVRLHGETPGGTVLDEPLLKAEHKGKFTARYSFVAKAHGLHSGDVMQYWIDAADNRAPKPNVVVTEKRLIRIISVDPNRQPPPDQVAQNDRQQRPPEPGKNGDQQNQRDQQNQDNQGQGDKNQGGAADQNNRASENQNGESGGQQQSGQNDKQQKGQESGEQQGGGESNKKDQQNSDSNQQQSKDSKGESKSGNSQSGGEGESKNSQGGEQQGGAPKPGENGQNSSQSKPANNSNQQSSDGSQRGQQNKDKQTGAGASGGERSNDRSQPDGARPDKQQGEKGGGDKERSQQQPGSEDQKTAVSPEGDNDGEAFERIQKRMEQNGDLKEDGDVNRDAQRSAEQKQGDADKGQQQQGKEQQGKKQGDQQQGKDQQGSAQQGKEQGAQQGKQQTAGAEKQQNGKSSNAESAADGTSAQKPEQQSGSAKQKQQQPGQDGGDAKRDAEGKNTGDNASEKNKQQSGKGAEQNKSPEGQESAGKGPSGAGDEREPQGSQQSQPGGTKPTEKRQQSGSKESTNKQEPPSGGGKRESNSSGDQGGDKAGGGEEGAGQKAPREGTGSPGQHQSADEGKGQSAEKGKGDTSSSGGQDREADHETGSSDGKMAGKGSQQKDGAGTQQGGKTGNQNAESRDGKNAAGEKGDQAGSKEGEAKGTDSKTQQDGKQHAEQAKQEGKEVGKQSDQKGGEEGQKNDGKDGKQDNKEHGNQGGQSGDGGHPGQPVAPQHSITGSAPEGDAANLEYARKQTDLVLGKLADQLNKNKVDDKILKDLGWTRDDLKRFVDRWQHRKDAAKKDDPAGEAAKRDLDDALRSLGLRRDKLQQSAVQKDSMRDLNQGYRGAVPLEYQERLRAYNQGVSRATGDGE